MGSTADGHWHTIYIYTVRLLAFQSVFIVTTRRGHSQYTLQIAIWTLQRSYCIRRRTAGRLGHGLYSVSNQCHRVWSVESAKVEILLLCPGWNTRAVNGSFICQFMYGVIKSLFVIVGQQCYCCGVSLKAFNSWHFNAIFLEKLGN